MDRRPRIVLFIVLFLGLARYFIAACFVHPFADDFSYAVAGMRTELLPRLWAEYHMWNGRWFSNILVLRGPLVLGMEHGLWLYRLVPVALLVLTWFGAFRLIRSAAPTMRIARAALDAALFVQVYLHLMPDLSEGIYWYTGAVSYQLPGALMLLLVAGWVRLLNNDADPASSGRPRIWLLALLAIVIAGSSEVHMVLMVFFHLLLLVLIRVRTQRVDRRVAVVFLLVLGVAMVMILAPGNVGRGGQFPHKHEIVRTLGWGTLQTGRFLLTWIASPALLLASVLFLLLRERLIPRGSMVIGAFFSHPIRVAILGVAMVFTVMALPYWATGMLGQHRTVNAALLLFLPLWFLLLYAAAERWGHRWRPAATPPAWASPSVCVLFGVVVLFTGNGHRLSEDLVHGRLAAFDAELKDRYARIQQAGIAHTTELRLPELEHLPRSLRYLDGVYEPGEWINRSLAAYFSADGTNIFIGTPPNGSKGPVASP